MKPLLLLIGLITLTSAQSCNEQNASSDCETGEKGKLSDLSGLDGCQWVIVDEEGQKYEPTNLGDFDIVLKDGKEVCFSYVIKNDMASICMVGPIIELKSLQ